MEVPHEKKQKIGEGSTDVEELGSTSGDQQMDLFSCLVCTLKAQWDNLDNHTEEYCEVCQPFTRSLPELTSSRISSAHASSVSFSDAILRQANNKREVACCRAIYGYKSSEGQGMLAIVKVGPSESRLSQSGEGERTNFKILVKIMEASQERGILFTFDSSHHYARASLPGLSLKHFYVGGTHLLRMAANILFSKGGVVHNKRAPFILDQPAEAQLATRVNDMEKEGSWSSLSGLPFVMVVEKLDVFDNKRLSAVCKDWQSRVTMECPKSRYSVGDGVPWIWHAKYGGGSTSREFIDCLGSSNRKFTVDMPEFSEGSVISSRGGWILVHQNSGIYPSVFSCWFLVNPFTKDRIELPKREGPNGTCCGSFTLRDYDGYPDRVVLIFPKPKFEVSVLTACPGDKVWRSSHDYSGVERNFSLLFTHVVIGDNVYCLDQYSYVTVFNVANNSVKVLPQIISLGCGFIAEHQGKLIYVEHGKNIVNYYKSFVAVQIYDEPSSSWKWLSPNAVMGTSWYLCKTRNVIAAKGRKGLYVYKLIHHLETKRRHPWYTYHDVYVSNLLTGKGRRIRVPSLIGMLLYWVAIG